MSPCDPRAAGTYGQVRELPPLQRARVCKDCATLTSRLCIRAGLERTALVTFLEEGELEVASLYLHSRMRNPPSPGIFPFAFGADRATSALHLRCWKTERLSKEEGKRQGHQEF